MANTREDDDEQAAWLRDWQRKQAAKSPSQRRIEATSSIAAALFVNVVAFYVCYCVVMYVLRSK